MARTRTWLALALWALSSVATASAAATRGDHELIGWKGESHTASLLRGGTQKQSTGKETESTQGTGPVDENRRWVEQLSWKPRAFLYHNLLTDEECDHLIQLAEPSMQKSTVVDNATGRSIGSNIRTSSGMFLKRGQDEVVARIEQKIADFTFIPIDHGEGFQVLHYEIGQKYEAHYDYFHDQLNTLNGGQRIATVLMYLSDVEEGGETVFPSASGYDATRAADAAFSGCARHGLAVKPKKGDALLFWSLQPSTELDPASLHAGCPVIRGNKWSATKWLRVGTYHI
eukprot:jgi/Chlat1/4394/Chrsp29S04541